MKKIALLFSGQGSQYLGMAKNLFDQHESVRDLFARASDLLSLDMESLCFSGSGDALSQTENTQPAILLVSLAYWEVFHATTGLMPVAMAGHSLGELSALTAAGAMTVEEGLRLSRARGLAMAKTQADCGMTAINKLPGDALRSICESVSGFGSEFVIANFNSPQQHVLSGRKSVLETVGERLKDAGGMVIPLRVSGAFHSPFMAGAIEEFEAELARIQFNELRIPVISNVTAEPHSNSASIKANLIKQMTSPVRWQESLDQLANQQGVQVFIEAGPKDVLKKLVNFSLSGVYAYALDEFADEAPMQATLAASIRAHWEKPTFLGKCLAVVVATRNTNWDEEGYQKGVIAPYQQLKEMHERYQSETTALNPEDVGQAVALVTQILECKGASADERQMRLQQIAEQTGMAKQMAAHLA